MLMMSQAYQKMPSRYDIYLVHHFKSKCYMLTSLLAIQFKNQSTPEAD